MFGINKNYLNYIPDVHYVAVVTNADGFAFFSSSPHPSNQVVKVINDFHQPPLMITFINSFTARLQYIGVTVSSRHHKSRDIC